MADAPVRQHLLRHIARVEEEYPLQGFHPLGVGGVADFYTVARTATELVAAVKAAADVSLPYLVIANGEGVLFSDGGFPGLVIQNATEQVVALADRTQIVADSGASLDRCIAWSASQGLGGLAPWYGLGGSVGGMLYANTTVERHQILDAVRSVTVLQPRGKQSGEPGIVRYAGEWLRGKDGAGKLATAKASATLPEPQPVILSAIFQMTKVRQDEILYQIQRYAQGYRQSRPAGTVWGPVFALASEGTQALDNTVQGVAETLLASGVPGLRRGPVFPDRYNPNFFRSRGRATAREVRDLIEAIQNQVGEQVGRPLHCRYEFLGVW
jgi:UDP-N-acetylmuramate dehydrogenase